MRSSILALGAALALATPAVAAPPDVRDFRLPTPGASPTPRPVGPVAPDVPESRVSRAAPSPTPTPTAVVPTPAPTPAPTASALRRSPAATPAPRPVVTTESRVNVASPAASPAGPLGDATEPPVAEPSLLPAAPAAQPPTSPAPSTAPTISSPEDEAEGVSWLWAIAGVLFAALTAGSVWALRLRRPRTTPARVPLVEKPKPLPASSPPASEAQPATATESKADPLQLALDPIRLSLTLVNAALAYRLEVANLGATPLEGLQIGADMISAHASMSREQQLAGPGAGAPTQHAIGRLEPGESRVVEGEFRLPFPQIVPIRQGAAALLLPLARFRAEAAGAPPVVRTFAVGQPGSSGLQPFRLDQGPRVYPRLAQRAFA